VTAPGDRQTAERRFRDVFSNLGRVTAYARRRGSADPDALAAEAMAIAWQRLQDVPRDDPLPWLYGTARNLLKAERRKTAARERADNAGGGPAEVPAPALWELDHRLDRALAALSHNDRELVLLVAWEDLTPAQAAHSLGINPVACRVRLHRARRRLIAALSAPPRQSQSAARPQSETEGTR
jgi:RNA polymerase sigma-70 factor, ECF subfamily